MENFWSFFFSVLWFFFLVMWLILLFHIVMDLFRDHSLSGWSKALWMVFLIFLPFLAVFIYLIVRGGSMAQREAERQVQAQKQFESYVRQTAGTQSPADQIASAKALLDQGAIDQGEFDRLKAKALA